jgi:hypothetical protein
MIQDIEKLMNGYKNGIKGSQIIMIFTGEILLVGLSQTSL